MTIKEKIVAEAIAIAILEADASTRKLRIEKDHSIRMKIHATRSRAIEFLSKHKIPFEINDNGFKLK